MVGILYPGVHCLKPHAMIDGGPVLSCGSGEMNSGRVNPDPTKMSEPCAILGQTFQPRSEILNAAHGVYIIDSGW